MTTSWQATTLSLFGMGEYVVVVAARRSAWSISSATTISLVFSTDCSFAPRLNRPWAWSGDGAIPAPRIAAEGHGGEQ
jgi:hypothetical protein